MLRSFTGAALLLVASSQVRAEECDSCGVPPAYALDLAYTSELWRNAHGGLRPGSRYLDNLDVALTIDGASAFGWEGVRLFASGLYNNGHVLDAELVGTLQGVSNIEATEAVRLYEMWMQWEVAPGRGPGASSMRVGLYDLNSEFDAIETAGLFMHPSHGIGADFAQSGLNGPSIFPTTSLAVRGAYTHGGLTLRTVVLDAVPGDPDRPAASTVRFHEDEGVLWVGEIDYRAGEWRFAGGYWQYSAEFPDLLAVDDQGEPRSRDDNAGIYAFVETPCFAGCGDQRGLRGFVRAGRAEESINALSGYFGAGAVYSGVFTDGDQLGLAVASARLGSPFKAAQAQAGVDVLGGESNFELTYSIAVLDWLTVQPDVQYVRHPGGDAAIADAWIFGLRFTLQTGVER